MIPSNRPIPSDRSARPSGDPHRDRHPHPAPPVAAAPGRRVPPPPLQVARALAATLAAYVLLSLVTGLFADLVGAVLRPRIPADSIVWLGSGLLLLAATSLQAATWLASIVLSAITVGRSQGALRTAGIVALVVVLVSGLTSLDIAGDPSGGGAEALFTGFRVIALLLDLAELAAGAVALVLLLGALRRVSRVVSRR